MKTLLGLTLAVALSGCAATAFKPTEVSASGTPYQGLNENSYGPRATTHFRYCDPQDDPANAASLPPGRARVAELASGVARGVGSVAGKPLQGVTKIDATLVHLGLADRFEVAGDARHPLVAVLSHGEDSIVFWHSVKHVALREVADAAQAYCAQRRKPLLYRGSASRCPQPERGLTGATILHTHAISAYACAGR